MSKPLFRVPKEPFDKVVVDVPWCFEQAYAYKKYLDEHPVHGAFQEQMPHEVWLKYIFQAPPHRERTPPPVRERIATHRLYRAAKKELARRNAGKNKNGNRTYTEYRNIQGMAAFIVGKRTIEEKEELAEELGRTENPYEEEEDEEADQEIKRMMEEQDGLWEDWKVFEVSSD